MRTTVATATGSVLGMVLLSLASVGTQLCFGDEPEKRDAKGASPTTLRQAIESRFGRPDRVVGERNSLLHYHLQSGDTLTIVVVEEKVVGIEHTRKMILKDVVGKEVTLVGVYNGLAKASDVICMADGQFFDIENRNRMAEHGKLVSVMGVLKYNPGTHGPNFMQGIPPHYYMEVESAELRVLYPIKFLGP